MHFREERTYSYKYRIPVSYSISVTILDDFPSIFLSSSECFEDYFKVVLAFWFLEKSLKVILERF